MNIIAETIKLDWGLFLLSLCTLAFCIKEIIEIVSYFKKKFRIKTGIDIDKETLENRISLLESHDRNQYSEISTIMTGIEEIKKSLELQEIEDKAKTIATLRTQLYDLHRKFMDQKFVDKSGLKTFLELGNIYEKAGGNDIYHDKLKPEIMELPIQEQ